MAVGVSLDLQSSTKAPQTLGSLFVCGWNVGFETWVANVFSDFEFKGILNRNHQGNFSKTDILVVGQRGPCPVQRNWINHNFLGKVVYFNGESYGPYYNKGREYVMGNIGLETNNHSFYFPYGFAVTIWKDPNLMKYVCDPSQKRVGTKEKFLIYSNSHCVEFREKAFRELSSLGQVEFGGRCTGGHWC